MNQMNGKDFKVLIESAGNSLSNNHHRIDALNVFPVPDGDTGTNMNLTFTSGLEQVRNMKSEHFSDVAKAFSKGLLMGARGNSGVILSQVFRGFSQAVEGKTEVTAKDLGEAFLRGSEVAYKAIMRPVEGTILTVVREAAWYANEVVVKDPDAPIEEYLEVFLNEAEESLKRTPDLLPVLKEVGVLDSGGAGFVEVMRGFYAASKGTPIEKTEQEEEVEEQAKEVGYRCQYILRLDSLEQGQTAPIEKLQFKLEQVGDHLVLFENKGLMYCSINTLMPGQVLNSAQRYGSFEKVQIENLSMPLNESIVDESMVEPLDFAIIAVASGDGLIRMFKDLGATSIVTGGQTMNPSTESFTQEIEKIRANHIIILPNNSNIVLAAKQTKDVLEDQDIYVLETKSIPQGLSALIAFDPSADLETNMESMEEAIDHVVSGSVTYSIKDTVIDGVEIKENDYMGIMDKAIVASTNDVYKTTRELIDHMIQDHDQDEYSVVTLIGGEGVDDADLELMKHYVTKKYPDFEVEASLGEQPVYSYYIGLD